MTTNNDSYTFKIVIFGDSHVGKSCIIRRFADDLFSFHHLATIGVDFRSKDIIYNDKKIKLQLWDTAGQERFRAISSSYCKGADGIIFSYDISSFESFTNVVSWIESFNDKTQYHDHARILIGNKCDLITKRIVTTEQGQSLASKYNMSFYETSALNNINVQEMFDCLVKEILLQYINEEKQRNIHLEEINAQNKKKCC